MAEVVVVGLGPAGPELVTEQTKALLHGDAPVWLRTNHHPAASLVPDAPTFDDVYDNAEKIQDVYATIVQRVCDLAKQYGTVVYAVPGSPLVAEHTVELLREQTEAQVTIVPALSFLELIWARLGVDPLTAMPRIIDGQRFAADAAGQTGPLIVAQCDSREVMSNIKLAFEDDTPDEVTVMQRLGSPDEIVETIAWADLDRVIDPDHLTTLWIPYVATPVAHDLERLHTVSRELRERCPWDKEQTHDSLKRYAIEEVYELIDAIDERSDNDADDEHIIEELGDVLYQVFAHAAVAEDEGRFNISDVARTVTEKLIHRHPHVYGDVDAQTADDVVATWESNKMKEKNRTSVLDGIPRSLPALSLATKVLSKTSKSETNLEVDAVTTAGVGKALLIMVEESKKQGIDPEEALRAAITEYMLLFQAAEVTSH